MKRTTGLVIFTTTSILLLTSLSVPVQARIKCWTNNEGIRECGTYVPPEYAQKGHQEISEHGTVAKQHDRTKTLEEIAEQERLAAIAAEKQKAADEQIKHDRILLDTFTTVDDIEMSRDGKIGVIESAITLSKKRNEKIQQDLDNRIQAAAKAERSGKTPDEALIKDIEDLRRQIKNNQVFIKEKHREQEAVRQAYNADIVRFNRLKAARK
ncbi:MAG: hypothetical protein O6928_08975 [Gammaproteobacteria bacterium]|nr:hypothetical protein [Gammaproteobacteria bacterium]